MKLKSLLVLVILSFQLFSCKKDIIIPDITTGMVAYFTMHWNNYDSINNKYGTSNNVKEMLNRRGESNGARNFKHDDTSYIDFGDHPNYSFPSNVFTVNCWIYPEDTFYAGSIISKRNAGGPFEYSIDNHFNHALMDFDNWVHDGAGTVYGTDPLNADAHLQMNKWQMITYVADGIELKVYLNGELQDGTDNYNSGKTFSDTNAPLMIGTGGPWGVNFYFDGGIDDIKFFNRALTDSQVRYLFQK